MSGHELPAIQEGSGFCTARPEGRVARAARKDRDQRTRLVLGNRREGHLRPGDEQRANPLKPVQGVGQLVTEADRLRTDCGGEIRRVHNAEHAHRKGKWDKLRGIRAHNEASRWQRQQTFEARETVRSEQLAGSSKRNAGSVRYDLINHYYANAEHAAVARYKDNVTQYTAVCRAQDLYNKDNRSGYNIITGEARRKDLVPSMPRPERPRGGGQ